ncbi:MAG: hypothetical protein LBT30_01800 [Clostridiales bacterium]|jgi:hypothetical protein|nr:hypothetical protein [Clostridiales bacterium]
MDIEKEILAAIIKILKDKNKNVAVAEISGNYFYAADAALDGGDAYRIAVIKHDQHKNFA